MNVRALPALLPSPLNWRHYATIASLAGFVLWCWWLWGFMLIDRPGFTDAYAYWSAELGPNLYAAQPGEMAYLYSPVVAQLYAPLTALPFPVFYGLLLAVNATALVYLVGPLWALPALLLPPVASELAQGNIHLLLAVALVRGAWWAFPLTKVTPSVTWLAGDWRSVARSAGIVAAAVGVSALVAPDLWVAWITRLAQADTQGVPSAYLWLDVPLWVRLIIAAGLALAARRWRWLLAPALVLSMPIVWVNSLAALLAIPRLTHPAHADGAQPAELPATAEAAMMGGYRTAK